MAWRRVWQCDWKRKLCNCAAWLATSCPHEVPGSTVDRRLLVNSGATKGIAQNGRVSWNLRKQDCVSKLGTSWSYTARSRELADDCGLCGKPNSRAQSRNAMATATRYCTLENAARGPQCRGTENKQTCLNEQVGKGIRSRMRSLSKTE